MFFISIKVLMSKFNNIANLNTFNQRKFNISNYISVKDLHLKNKNL